MDSETRPSWDEYFMAIAEKVATRSTCSSRKVGAVIVVEKRMVATGYNGAPHGMAHCTDVGCKLVTVTENGESEEKCDRVLHAEQNAIIQCAMHGVSCRGATIYTTARPCRMCAKMIANAGIKRVLYCDEPKDREPFEILKAAGVEAQRLAAAARKK
jgi:dCMP deaminase